MPSYTLRQHGFRYAWWTQWIVARADALTTSQTQSRRCRHAFRRSIRQENPKLLRPLLLPLHLPLSRPSLHHRLPRRLRSRMGTLRNRLKVSRYAALFTSRSLMEVAPSATRQLPLCSRISAMRSRCAKMVRPTGKALAELVSTGHPRRPASGSQLAPVLCKNLRGPQPVRSRAGKDAHWLELTK